MGQMNTIGRPIGRGGATSRIYSRVGHRWPSFGRRSLGRLGLPGGRNVAQAGGFALGAARRGSSAKGWGGLAVSGQRLALPGRLLQAALVTWTSSRAVCHGA